MQTNLERGSLSGSARSPSVELHPEYGFTEPVRDSDIPVQMIYVETIDGLYAPIGLRVPPGGGPFPLVRLLQVTAAAVWLWFATSRKTEAGRRNSS
jgi:hypothetical protein